MHAGMHACIHTYIHADICVSQTIHITICICIYIHALHTTCFDSHTRTEQARLHSLHIATFITGTKVASSASAIHMHHKHTNARRGGALRLLELDDLVLLHEPQKREEREKQEREKRRERAFGSGSAPGFTA